MKRTRSVNGASSRREFLKRGSAAAAIGAAMPLLSGETAAAQSSDDARTLDRLARANADRDRRILLKGGTIVSMDGAVGNFAQGDVLIQGKKIASIGADLSAAAQGGKAIVVDAKDMILIPGFCDPHIHSWQGQIPRIVSNQISAPPGNPTHSYNTVMHETMALSYRPKDMYAGTLMTMLVCINAGITTVCDNSHNSRSGAHSDAAIQALFDAGIRGVHASGNPHYGNWDHQWPQDLERLKKHCSSDDQLVTLRLMYAAGPGHRRTQRPRPLDHHGGRRQRAESPRSERSGDYNGKESYNHARGFPLPNMRAIVDHGAKVNVCPRIDSQYAGGASNNWLPAYQDWLNLGLRPGFSNDDPATYAVDMFTEMHVMYALHRGAIMRERANGNPNPPPEATTRDMLESATIRGAECCGVAHKVGTLTPGKEADIVLINTNDIHLYPKHNVITSVVEGRTSATSTPCSSPASSENGAGSSPARCWAATWRRFGRWSTSRATICLPRRSGRWQDRFLRLVPSSNGSSRRHEDDTKSTKDLFVHAFFVYLRALRDFVIRRRLGSQFMRWGCSGSASGAAVHGVGFRRS
jgi:cytosine/adenosine deaminase-related metal-dependent hydrolase